MFSVSDDVPWGKGMQLFVDEQIDFGGGLDYVIVALFPPTGAKLPPSLNVVQTVSGGGGTVGVTALTFGGTVGVSVTKTDVYSTPLAAVAVRRVRS